MSDEYDVAKALFGTTPTSADSTANIIYGVAVSDSSDGSVSVQMNDGSIVDIRTSPNVKNGDKVLISLVNHTPTVTANVGSGDVQQAKIEEAYNKASAAQQTAAEAKTFLAACSTAVDVAAKTVTGVADFSLAVGVCITVVFSNANTSVSPTLNVNSTGARSIKLNGAPYAYWVSGSTVAFVYDGTNWQVCNTPLYGSTSTIGNPAGGNVFTDSDSVDIRNGTQVLATFMAGSGGSGYAVMKGFGSNLSLMVPNTGTVAMTTYDPSTGYPSDAGIGMQGRNPVISGGNAIITGTSGSNTVPVESLYNHCISVYPAQVLTTTSANTWKTGTFGLTAVSGQYLSLSRGVVYVNHTGKYLVCLYAAWANNASGDIMHFGIGSSASNVKCAIQRRVTGPWDTGSKAVLINLTSGTALVPMVKCEQGGGNSLSTGGDPGNAGNTYCTIMYVGE